MTTFSEAHLSMKAKFSFLLAERGWVPFVAEHQNSTAGTAKKSYKTAVGTKEAVAYFMPSSECIGFMRAHYESEGRNIVDALWYPVRDDITDEQLADMVDKFATEIDKQVGQSYAMRLMSL